METASFCKQENVYVWWWAWGNEMACWHSVICIWTSEQGRGRKRHAARHRTMYLTSMAQMRRAAIKIIHSTLFVAVGLQCRCEVKPADCPVMRRVNPMLIWDRAVGGIAASTPSVESAPVSTFSLVECSRDRCFSCERAPGNTFDYYPEAPAHWSSAPGSTLSLKECSREHSGTENGT